MSPGTLHRVGGARLNVRLARRLAAEGFASIRFDFSGLGDSEPRTDALPYLASMVQDLREAMDELSRHVPSGRFVLIGHCTGAAISYETALADPRVIGIVQIEGFAYRTALYQFHRWRRILGSRANWRALMSGEKDLRPIIRRIVRHLNPLGRSTAPQALEQASVEDARRQIRNLDDLLPARTAMRVGLTHLISRQVRMLSIYAGGDHHYYSYRTQFSDAFPGLDFREMLELEHVTDADHYFSASRHQAWLDDRIAGWLEGFVTTDPTGRRTWAG